MSPQRCWPRTAVAVEAEPTTTRQILVKTVWPRTWRQLEGCVMAWAMTVDLVRQWIAMGGMDSIVTRAAAAAAAALV